MPVIADYQRRRTGHWHLAVLAGQWNQELQREILALVERQPSTKHPQTFELASGGDNKGKPLYLKVFCPPPGIVILKNMLRKSKAARFLHQGLALCKAGFRAPLTIAAGERRGWTFSSRAFVLTVGIEGQSLVSYLDDCWSGRRPPPSLEEKRKALRRLAGVIRKFHDLGFVHGDLVPSNVFVSDCRTAGHSFYFMDNDRTRRFPPWLPQVLWKRNLVQLNRFPLPGISLQDRMRFLRGYLGKGKWGRKEARLSRWLEDKTRKRRKECGGIPDSIKFRELMRWNGPWRRAPDD